MSLSCIRYVKDTILKAIYNSHVHSTYEFKLYSICQRYNFESNLQPLTSSENILLSCIRYVKDTILKAIYNIVILMLKLHYAVFDMSKIQF